MPSQEDSPPSEPSQTVLQVTVKEPSLQCSQEINMPINDASTAQLFDDSVKNDEQPAEWGITTYGEFVFQGFNG